MQTFLTFSAGLLTALLIFYAVNARYIRNMRRKKKAEDKGEKKLQETKVIVRLVMATYFLAFLIGAWVVICRDIYQLGTLLTFVGSVAVFAVAFYCWKSKAENLEKIKQSNPDLQGTLSDFSNMSSQ